MEFRTPVTLPRIEPFVSHRSHMVSLGSCFADEIGARLSTRLYNILVNPVGTLYNPASIKDAVERIAGSHGNRDNSLIQDSSGIWHSFDYHSRFSSVDRGKVLASIRNAEEMSNRQLKSPDPVVTLTFGSARAFKLKENGKIVANCHKFPGEWFETIDMSVGECKNLMDETVNILRDIAPSVKIIMTVSPIRHKAYGLHEDKLSKAKLLLAVDETVRNFSDTYYFPAYEIMMDDLRDYRFYDSDMTHPSTVAIDYIFECFSKMFIPQSEEKLDKKCISLIKRLLHRPLTHNEETIKIFEAENLRITDELISDYPEIETPLKRFVNDRT